ncbi:MAG: sulfatase, partial [Planctomycetales bacterium]|nr:sulfatase [Planctomycetales bacterium]
LVSVGVGVCAEAGVRPNFLIIMADDCTYNDLPVYGGQNAITPNIDALATRGLTFNHAYLCSAMCQPCRAELFTGRYPLSNGCAWNHSASHHDARSLPHLLRPLGYRVGLAGKVHVLPQQAFPFDQVAGFDPNCVRNPTRKHELQSLREYISSDHESPFCLVVALVEPHVPWVMGDASQYPPRKIQLPPNLADTQLTRKHFADYLAEITYMDGQVGEILAALRDSGNESNTVVMFTSEQGSQFPGCKWTNWNTGVHSAMIVAWPGHVTENERTDAIVQYADVAPTLLDVAGEKPDLDAFDGSSFANVLTGQAKTHRQFAFGMHNNLPEGPAYPIRSITDGKFRYIRNLTPDELYVERHLMGGGRLNNPYWSTWLGADPVTKKSVYDRAKRYMLRPAEQLYKTSDDPYELTDVGGDPQYQEVKKRLSARLDQWMREQSDPGKAVDTVEALKAARSGKHLHGPGKANTTE